MKNPTNPLAIPTRLTDIKMHLSYFEEDVPWSFDELDIWYSNQMDTKKWVQDYLLSNALLAWDPELNRYFAVEMEEKEHVDEIDRLIAYQYLSDCLFNLLKFRDIISHVPMYYKVRSSILGEEDQHLANLSDFRKDLFDNLEDAFTQGFIYMAKTLNAFLIWLDDDFLTIETWSLLDHNILIEDSDIPLLRKFMHDFGMSYED